MKSSSDTAEVIHDTLRWLEEEVDMVMKAGKWNEYRLFEAKIPGMKDALVLQALRAHRINDKVEKKKLTDMLYEVARYIAAVKFLEPVPLNLLGPAGDICLRKK